MPMFQCALRCRTPVVAHAQGFCPFQRLARATQQRPGHLPLLPRPACLPPRHSSPPVQIPCQRCEKGYCLWGCRQTPSCCCRTPLLHQLRIAHQHRHDQTVCCYQNHRLLLLLLHQRLLGFAAAGVAQTWACCHQWHQMHPQSQHCPLQLPHQTRWQSASQILLLPVAAESAGQRPVLAGQSLQRTSPAAQNYLLEAGQMATLPAQTVLLLLFAAAVAAC